MKTYLHHNKNAYDELAAEYELKSSLYEKSDVAIVAPFIEYLNSTFSQVHVLELGPGSGLALQFFSQEQFETTAIDISDNIISVAKKRSSQTSFICSDFLSYDFAGKTFQGIFAKAFIHLFPKDDVVLVLKKVHDLLEDDGLFSVFTTVHDVSTEGYYEKTDYASRISRFRRKWSEPDLISTIEKAGFTIYAKKYSAEENGKNWINVLLKKV